ncbi:hypothetical protein N8D56_09895 [Devosia sp. A8/3-2]|nr:hypothetical protein N8D56_09895 [Devosia sp. A8/3-2]
MARPTRSASKAIGSLQICWTIPASPFPRRTRNKASPVHASIWRCHSEVAEHLSPARAVGFVADLVALAPAILFSAAIPGRGGVGHSNEQWQSYWAGLFAAHGYRPFDVLRPQIWTDEAIPARYRQNAILYLDAETATQLALVPDDAAALDKVHPAFWNRANRELKYANALPESEVLRRQAQQAQQ